MDLFFSNNISSDQIILSEIESKHCLLSLRKKINDSILITNGQGVIYHAQIKNIKNKQVICEDYKIHHIEKNNINISIGISPIKNKNRFEWFLEKSTEIGIHNIYPIVCDKSEKKTINKKRGEKIIMSAMKQSHNSTLPILHELSLFKDIFKKQYSHSFIAHCHDLPKILLTEELIKSHRIQDVCILIGPEGDFSHNELQLAKENRFQSVSLSKNRLRTETAGIIACNLINALL